MEENRRAGEEKGRKVDRGTRLLNKEADFSQPLFQALSLSRGGGVKPDLRVSKLADSPTVGGVKWWYWVRCRCGGFDQGKRVALWKRWVVVLPMDVLMRRQPEGLHPARRSTPPSATPPPPACCISLWVVPVIMWQLGRLIVCKQRD